MKPKAGLPQNVRLSEGLGVAMALSPETRAHFESIGPSDVLLEIAERKHGQAPDSPSWREAMLWVEAHSIKERDARERSEELV